MIDRIFAAPKHLQDEDKGIAFALEHELGYEIPTFADSTYLIHSDQHLEDYKTKYQKIRGWLSLQGPVDRYVNPLSSDPEIALCSLHRYTQAINVCKSVGAKYLIFQSPYSPIQRVSGKYNDWVSVSTNFWKQLIEEQLRSTDIMVLVANTMESDPSLLLEVIHRVDSPRFKACLDIAYANLFSKKPAIDWLDDLGQDVEYVRGSNNDGLTHSHSPFDKGSIDMGGFINHMALLPKRLNLAINVHDLDGLHDSYLLIQPYLQMQQEQMSTKSLII